MKPHTTYRIYPKAINEFISDHYDLNSINFGNIENNVIAILQKLKIDTVLECEWDVNPLYFFDKMDVSKNYNKPSDFGEYSNFKFSFSAKDGKTVDEYEKAIQKLETEFINKYQHRIKSNFLNYKKQLTIDKKKKERTIYGLVFIVVIVLISILLIFNKEIKSVFL